MKKLLFLLMLPCFVHAQRAIDITSMQKPLGPTVGTVPTAITGFVSVSGTLGTPQTFTLSWSNWVSGNITVTAPSGYVVSQNNVTYTGSTVVTTSGSSGSVTVYAALAAANTGGSFSGTISCTASGATSGFVTLTGTTTGNPTLSVSTGTLSGFTSTAGTQGASKNYTLTGSQLTGNITVTAPSGYVVSKDNSSFAGTQTVTPSGGTISQIIYAALAAANTNGSYSGNVTNAGGGATTQNVAVSGSTGSVTPDTIAFHFDTSAISVPGMVTVTGDASKRIISGAVSGTTITYTSVATANWVSGLASCVFPNDGITNSTIPTGATNACKECWFSSQITSTSVPQFVVGGLKTDGTTYDVYVSGTTSFTSVNSLTQFIIKGASTLSSQTLTAIAGSTPNTTVQLHFGPVAPDGSGNITVYMGKNDSGQQYGFWTYLIIKKH